MNAKLCAWRAKAAVAPLGLVDIDGRLLGPGDADAFRKLKIPKQSQYALVSSLDNMGLLRPDRPSLFAPADLQRVFDSPASRAPRLKALRAAASK